VLYLINKLDITVSRSLLHLLPAFVIPLSNIFQFFETIRPGLGLGLGLDLGFPVLL